MHEHEVLVFLLSLAVLLSAARLLGEGARRLGFPLIFGELASGILLGPTVFGRITPAGQHALFPGGIPANMLAGYTNVVWYAGAATHAPSTNQQQALEQWLDTGGKRLVVFAENLGLNLCLWTGITNPFFVTYVGAVGCASDVYSYVQEAPLSVTSYVVTGIDGTPFGSFTYSVTQQTPIASTADVINPATGTSTLATVSVDPTFDGGDSPTPVVVGHTKGTSTIVYVGLPIEDIAASSIGTRQMFFHATLVYLGIVN